MVSGIWNTVIRRMWWLVLGVLAIPALRPLFVYGVTQSFDGETHLLRLALLDYHIQHGTLFPRWMPELILGKGAPVLTYYAPLTYYVAEVFHLTGLNHNASLAAAMGLFVFIAGCGMFLLARDVYGQQSNLPALLAATAYMSGPYLLSTVYIRAGIAEVGAQAVLPWVLWSIRRLLRDPEPSVYVVPVFLSLSVLALSHNITLLVTPPMLAGYIVALWWQEKWTMRRTGLLVLAVVASAGATAFFWGPVVFERGFLSGSAYEVAAQIFIPRNVWHWNNFVGTSFRFTYSPGMPFRLGLVQLLLASAGAILARRRDPEWLFLIFLAVVTGLCIGAWTLPLWLSSPVLLVVQFPWRLLSLMSLSMALLTGGIVLRIRRPATAFGVAAFLIGLVVLANAPRVDWLRSIPAAFDDLSLARIARYEKIPDNLGGAGYTGEFTPRWVGSVGSAPEQEETNSLLDVDLQEADAFTWRGTVTSQAGGPLRFTSFYFPGWQALLDDGIPLRTYPSAKSGLLVIDLPPGVHEFSVTYGGTTLQRWATIGSLLALAGLAWATAYYARHRRVFLVPLALLVGAAVLFYWPSTAQTIRKSVQPVQTAETKLLGYRVERHRPDHVTVFPYWFVSQRQGDHRMRWQLRDDRENLIDEITQAPYYDTAVSSEWQTGTLVNDAVEFGLPVDLPAGRYKLYVQLETPNQAGQLQYVGPVELSRSIQRAQPEPLHTKAARFGDGMFLEGYDLELNGKSVPDSAVGNRTLVVQPGDVLQYTLYWRAAGSIVKDYRARVEIVDSTGIGISGDEHVAGGFLTESTSWDAYHLIRDTYQLIVPPHGRPETYSVQVRAYDPDLSGQLDVTGNEERSLGDHLALHSIKILDDSVGEPQNPMTGRIGDSASFLGYDLSPEALDLRPGSQFTATLYYQVDRPTDVDYTRFVHLGNPQLGMAAQRDSYPQEGRNPTHSWIAGEVISDPVRLTVAQDALQGEYILTAGFYDLQANVQRLPLLDSHGRPVLNDEFELTRLQIH